MKKTPSAARSRRIGQTAFASASRPTTFSSTPGAARRGGIKGPLLAFAGLFALGLLGWYYSRHRDGRDRSSVLDEVRTSAADRPEASAPADAQLPISARKPIRPEGLPIVGSTSPGIDWPVRLTDVTNDTGITFQHTDGSSGKFYIVESITGGLALFDYDQDRDLDIYFLNGAPLKGTEFDVAPTNALYRNEGNWRFTDVTERAGVGDAGYGLGVCVGDYDNDGDPDLYVNNFGANALYKNSADGTFTAVTEAAGVANGQRVGAGASFLDLEGDGDLDLYVANYVQFTYADYRPHTLKGLPAYPGPLTYLPESDNLFRNDGDGTFTDVSVESGVAAHAGTGMGVVCSDYDSDGDTDVFVGNDQMPNFLFQNDGSGRFQEVGLLAGTALDFRGHAQATMGVDAGDFNNDGRIDLHATSFADEFATLYQNRGSGIFEDVTRRTRAGAGTFPHVTWGNGFADFDNDGNRDLFIACGHLDVNLQRDGESTSYEVPNLLLRNTGHDFVDVSRHSGDGMRVTRSSRGMALGDLDDDGDTDVVVLNSRNRPTLLRNDSTSDHHWIRVRLCGTSTNRSGVGATVRVVAGELVQTAEVHSGRGYQSHFGDPPHFGLGDQNRIDRIEVRWSGGGSQSVDSPPIDTTLTIIEDAAATALEPLQASPDLRRQR